MLFDSFEAYDVQETRRVSRAEGKAEGKAELILDFLEELKAVPEDLKTRIMAEQDLEKLKAWAKLAVKAASLEEFREKAGL